MINPPVYWQNEISGRMARIVYAYFRGGELPHNDLIVLRRYVIQWVDRMEVPRFVRARVECSYTTADLRAACRELLDYGVDPF
jgi:hypothetical protein